MKKTMMALAVAAALPLPAQAQESKDLADVVISGRPLQTPVLQRSVSSDTAGLLANQPGVSLYGAGGVSSLPAIHGLADDRVKVEVDGMSLISACANHMNPPLSYIDPSNLGSLNVMAGITPVSAGGDSIGGTIRANSPAPAFAAPGQGKLRKGEAGVFLRSNGNARGGHLEATLANESLSLRFNASTVEAANYKVGGNFKAASSNAWNGVSLAADEVGASAYKAGNQSVTLAWLDAGNLVDLKFGRQHIPWQGFPNQRMDMTANDSHQANLHWLGRFDWGTLDARVYHEKTRHTMNFLQDKVRSVLGMPMDTEGDNTGAVAKADIKLSRRDMLRVGGEYQRYRLNDWWDPVSTTAGMMAPNVFWNIRDGQRDRLEVFAEWDARWSARWFTQLGLRSGTVKMDTGRVQGYNTLTSGMGAYGDPANPASIPGAFNAADRKKTDHNIDLTALARYTPGEEASYEFGFARKSRSPNLYERFAWSTNNTMVMNMVNWSGEANGYVGNLNLKPEVANTLSATADWHDAAQEKWNLKLTPYYTRVSDYIDAQRCPVVAGSTACTTANLTATTGFVYLQFVNQNARLHGADLSGYLALGRLGSYGDFTLNGVVNYVDGRNETTGDNLYNILPLSGRFALVQQAGAWTNTLETQMVAAKHQVSAVRNEVKTGGYNLINLKSSYAWKQGRVDFGIDNLFDRFYNLPQGGAYVGERNKPYGIAVPGMGRSVNAALTLKF